jgi:hypothetical protein
VRVLLSVLLLLFCGCSLTSWQRSHTVVNEKRLIVEIEQLTFEGEPKDAGFDHPAAVSMDGLVAFFRHLRYQYPSILKTTVEPVVSRELVEKLSLALSEGLALAGPSQRLRFVAHNMHTKLKLLPVAKTTRGVAFVKPAGVLNLAFDLIDDEPEVDPSDPIFFEQWEDPTRSTVSTYKLVLPPGSTFYRDEGGERRPLWITVPLEVITPERGTPPPAPGTDPAEADPGDQKPPEEGGEEPPPAELTDQERIIRLRYLQELYEKGILTEQQYKDEWKRIFREY